MRVGAFEKVGELLSPSTFVMSQSTGSSPMPATLDDSCLKLRVRRSLIASCSVFGNGDDGLEYGGDGGRGEIGLWKE